MNINEWKVKWELVVVLLIVVVVMALWMHA